MNGIVATLALPLPRRLLRGLIFLTCCALSVSLIGAVDTRPREASRSNEDTTVAPEGAVELAAYQVPARRTLLPAPAVPQPQQAGELLHDAKLAPAADEALPDVTSVAASIASTVEKFLSNPTTPAAARAPRVLWMEVTAYCPCKKCCGPRAQGLTASGRPVSHNGGRFVAADTKVLAFNTRLLIPGYADGAAVPVIDRGGAIKGPKLDVFFPTHDQARQWGRRWVPVTVVE